MPLSSAEAVLIYASDFAPSWAGAISIDILPAILVLILSVAHSAIREDTALLEPAERISAAEMIRAVSMYQEMTSREKRLLEERAGNVDNDDNRSDTEAQSSDGDEPEDGDTVMTGSGTTLLRPVAGSQRDRIEKSRK
mgnify:CR=1 FL=1